MRPPGGRLRAARAVDRVAAPRAPGDERSPDLELLAGRGHLDDHRAARLDVLDLLARVGRPRAEREQHGERVSGVGGPLAVSDREAAQVIAAQAARVRAPAAGDRVAVRDRLVQVAGRPSQQAIFPIVTQLDVSALS